MKVNYQYYHNQRHPIKTWTNGVEMQPEAFDQLSNVASMPFIHSHVAAMPDVHWGMGATVGSVIPTKGAIIPAAVGVDIGCGMMAVRTTLRAEHLPDNLDFVRAEIERAIAHGRTNNGKKNDKGSWASRKHFPFTSQWLGLQDRYDNITRKHPKAESHNNWCHLGSLGTGNHFIELCLDEEGFLWAMLHSGSRGAGNRIGSYFIEKAKEEMERYHISEYLPDRNLSYLVEHTQLFDDYVEAVLWAQDFARANREAMMELTLKAVARTLGPFDYEAKAINCHHNYVEKENHYGENVWLTRKGAVRARKDDLGIIPGSMGTGSFIVRGKGSPDSFHSCSHGAGRVMSRGQAKKLITLEEHTESMKGISARLDEGVLDESPRAYKDIGAVMAAQDDLVEIVHRLRQVVNVKG